MEKTQNTSIKKYQDNWDIVDNALGESINSGYKMAVIETEKILRLALDEKKIPGNNIMKKIKNAKIFLSNPQKLDYSRAMYEKIISEPGFDISSEDTKEIVAGYYKAISDITEIKTKNIPFKEKVNFFLQRYFGCFLRKTKILAISLFLFFLAIFISTETSTGNSISLALASFSQFLFYTIFGTLLKVLAIAIAVIGILYYWQKRK
jgi:hypothetical protein